MLDSYTHVLESIASLEDEAKADEMVSKLIHHLVSSGRAKLLPQIHAELKKIAARRKALAPVVEAASEHEAATALAEAKKEGIEAKKAVVNHALIQGWRARGNGKLIDRSAKAALIGIYQKVTT